MNIKSVIVGAFETNCYIVWNKENQAIVIDPGDEAERILAEIKKYNLSVIRYMLTHGHVDHITAVRKLSAHMPASVIIHKADAEWAFTSENSFEPYYSAPEKPSLLQFYPGDGSSILEEEGMRCRILYTPGHTPGSVCLYFPDESLLFSGDTLFAGSVGRTDLPGGDSLMLKSSLQKLMELPDKGYCISRTWSGNKHCF